MDNAKPRFWLFFVDLQSFKICTIFINMESLRTLHCKVVTCRMGIKRILAIHISMRRNLVWMSRQDTVTWSERNRIREKEQKVKVDPGINKVQLAAFLTLALSSTKIVVSAAMHKYRISGERWHKVGFLSCDGGEAKNFYDLLLALGG